MQLKQNIVLIVGRLPLSVVSKINAIKMVVLPWFLHLFLSVQCFISVSYFKQLGSIIIPFI